MIHAVLVACLLGQARPHLVKDEAASEAVFSDHVAHQTAEQNKIRDHILSLSPLGSSPDQVLKVVRDVLHKSGGYKKDYFDGYLTYIAGSIGVRYKEESSWLWLTGTDTDVVWYFNAHDQLVNVIVQDWNTGP
jgi:hypothetical protein